MSRAELHVTTVAGRSTVVNAWARNPLSLLVPRARGESVCAYSSTFGGGVVAGDETSLEIQIDGASRCFLGTQASTKIYRNPEGRPCSHTTRAKLGPGSLLVYAPDPVQCFTASAFDQTQTFSLAPDGNLLLIDSVTGGRTARGERWQQHRYTTRNEIYQGDRLMFLDALRLENDGTLQNRFRIGPSNCLATVVMLGPMLAPHAAGILRVTGTAPVKPTSDLFFSASPLREGLVLRFAGGSIEQISQAIQRNLAFLPALLSDNPWARKF